MIKFFRRIRKNLLTENKTGKYFKYALGEIILVVIGILIALQINLKSQDKTNRKEIESILKSVFVNLENDIAHPINTYIIGLNQKDSISTIILSKTLTYEDYVKENSPLTGFANHLIFEFEPFQFQRQAYDRLMANIENIPEDYIPIVNLLQDVYGKEAPVVNEVALELKSFIDEIEDKYQNTYEWYSDSDSEHFNQKVAYMLNDPLYLNDVKRHQKITDHLRRHLVALKTQILIAYSKIYDQLNYSEPFPDNLEQYSFPSKEELNDYAGIYENDQSDQIILESGEFYLNDVNGNIKLVQKEDRFLPSADPTRAFLKFTRSKKGAIEGLNIFQILAKKDTVSIYFRKIN